MKASPSAFTSQAPNVAAVSRNSVSCSRSARVIASGQDSHKAVEPSISLKRIVTRPVGGAKLVDIMNSIFAEDP